MVASTGATVGERGKSFTNFEAVLEKSAALKMDVLN
jgi:hypothetical protein